MSARKGQFLIYIMLFSLSVAIPSLNSACMIAIVGINFLYIITKNNIELSVLSTMVMGNEMFSLSNALVCIVGLVIIKRTGIKSRRWEVKGSIIFIACLILANSILNGIFNNTLINVIFYVGYLLILFVCYKGYSGVFKLRNSVKAIQQLIIIEAIATVIRIEISRTIKPGDYFAGTLNNAHFFGNWLVMTSIVLYILYKRRDQFGLSKSIFSKNEIVIYFAAILAMLYLADAKQIVFSFIIAIAVYHFVKIISLRRNNVLFWTIIGMYIGVGLLLWLCCLDPVKNLLSSMIPGYSIHIYQNGFNGRYAFAYGTYFDSLANLRFFFGYGLGQYGSRVANAFAYSEMWRADNFINNFIANNFAPHFVPQFVRYIRYYNSEFVEMIQYYSAVLSYPFSSFIALLGETGIVGTSLVAYLINKEFKRSDAQFLIVYFLSMCVFDIYFDDFQCVIALILYLELFHKNLRKILLN